MKMFKNFKNFVILTAVMSVGFVSCLEDIPEIPEGDFVGSMEGAYNVKMETYTLIDSVMEKTDDEAVIYAAAISKDGDDEKIDITITGQTIVKGINCRKAGVGVAFDINDQTVTIEAEEEETLEITGVSFATLSNAEFIGTYDIRKEKISWSVKEVVEIPEGEEETFVQYVYVYSGTKVITEEL
ncbi:hypothetical protein E9993_15995 [Labilibacter sediminis]|nr:hypothetical protein E9993_15995 [Labilibacter sediminis]